MVRDYRGCLTHQNEDTLYALDPVYQRVKQEKREDIEGTTDHEIVRVIIRLPQNKDGEGDTPRTDKDRKSTEEEKISK